MKTVAYTFNGQTYHLCLNGTALFDIYDRYGTEGSVAAPIHGSSREAFRATCWYLAKLAEQGELARRYLGYDRGPIATELLFQRLLRPADVPAARRAIVEAVGLGFAREEPGEASGEVDLGLLELEKKTAEG